MKTREECRQRRNRIRQGLYGLLLVVFLPIAIPSIVEFILR